MAKKSSYRRLNSYRMWNWDYGANACYFITLVTLDRMRVLGEVAQNGMVLSPAGSILDNLIRAIPQQFPYATILTHIVMPDHLHILICLQKTEADFQADAPRIQPYALGGPLPHVMHRNDIPRIMRWLKARGSYEIRKHLPEFAWQRSYHDRIMRSSSEVSRFWAYTDNNPAKEWAKQVMLRIESEYKSGQ
jgi:putative transposase